MNNPKIYGFCPAGCKWETVHRNEFDASKSAYPIYENTSDHTYHLTNPEINLLEENPYYDLTQRFKIYDGTAGTNEAGTQKWNVAVFASLYINGTVYVTREITLADRNAYEHEIDFVIESINREGNVTVTVITSRNRVSLSKSLTDATSVGIDVYVKNLGYPYTTDEGTTTERVDGCENTRVYSLGYSKGFFEAPYTKAEIDEKLNDYQPKSIDESNESYGENNFVSGNDNVVGTKGYRIESFSGVNGETGSYTIDGTEEDALAIQALIDKGERLYWTIINNMSCDYFGKITKSYYSGACHVEVTNFYTNQPETSDGVQIYLEDCLYNAHGYPYTYAPELGYSIQNSVDDNFPHIIINDHPELGTHYLTGRAVSFGVGNISQGEQSFTQGGGNRTYGAYSSAQGQDNQVGFDTHALGRLNYAPSAQDCFIAGFANTIRGFVNSGVTVVGAHNNASRDAQFVAGIMNNNKKNNLFEIGGGTFPNVHHNAFEVDENGIVYSNEQPLPLQKIINKTLSPSIDILGGNYTSLIGKDLIGKNVSFTPSNYFSHLRIDCTKISLTVGSRYCMVVEFTLDAPSGSDVSWLELKNSTYDSTGGVKHRSIDFHGAKIGKNYLIYPFAHEDWYEEIGLYGYMPSTGFSGSITYNSVSLYPMSEIAPDYPDYSFSADDIGIIHRTIEKVSGQNFVKYHSVIQTNPLEREYLLTDVAAMNTGSFQGLYAICPNATSSVNISVYSGNEATNFLFSKINS